QKYVPGSREGSIYRTANGQYITADRIVAKNRTLQPAMIWIDVPVEVVSRLDSIYVGQDGIVEPLRPVLAVFNARPSQLNARMFTSFGGLRETYRLMAFGWGALRGLDGRLWVVRWSD